MRRCAECSACERETEPVVALVSRPNADHANLRIREYVCIEHLTMLRNDYGAQVTIERLVLTASA